jgi:hypothetical protein
MKRFLVLYESSMASSELMASSTPEQMQAGMEMWRKWADAAGSGIVDLGSPLGEGRSVGGSGGADRVTGFSILQAESAADLDKLLDGHPHLQSPGNPSIAVYEFLAVPGT